jgi:hypothetical protein
MMMLLIGIVVFLVGTANLISVVRRQGERFEYAGAMLLLELGLMFVAGYLMPPGNAEIAVTVAFGLGIFSTMGLWWKYFLQYRREAHARS